MHTEIGRLNPKKATTFKNIPSKVLKNSSEMCSASMQLIFNDCVQNGLFPALLKLADVSSLHKIEEKTRKKNYRIVNILPTVSKGFERLLDEQIIDCFMLISTKPKHKTLLNQGESLKLKIRNDELEVVQKTKYLGVQIVGLEGTH